MAWLCLYEKRNMFVIARRASQQSWINIMEKKGFKLVLTFESNIQDVKNSNTHIFWAEWIFGKDPVARCYRIALDVDKAHKKHKTKKVNHETIKSRACAS